MSAREYHYVMTLQHHGPSGPIGTAAMSGVVTPAEGTSREELFQELFQYVCGQAGIAPARATVLFFDLAPNELS